ncbi:MAG TPA: hypothetical protein VHW66_08405 [Stellaceae bacterium]|nr:hypothetical protein [Stellaceae bacterium]
MIDLRRTPSIQHAVVLIGDTEADTIANIKRLEARKINISLNLGRRLFKPMMEGFTLDWAITQCKLSRRPQDIKPCIDLITAFDRFARGKAVPWFRLFPKDYYPIGPSILMPINPHGFWAQDGKLKLLWAQSWKLATLSPLQKAIFNTILDQRVFVGDFKNADLEWVDLREQIKGKGRDIEILSRSDLGLVSFDELKRYLDILYAAFFSYSEEAKVKKAEEKSKAKPKPAPLIDGIEADPPA